MRGEILYTYSDNLVPADTTLSDILYKDEFGADYAVFAFFLISNRLYNDPLPETPTTFDAFNKEITYRN